MNKILNPWIIAIVSILISVGIYLVINYFRPMEDFIAGLFMSTIIPAVIAYPVAKILLNYNDKIKDQNEELRKSYGDISELTEKLNSIELLKANQIGLNKQLQEKNKKLTQVNEALDSFTYHVSHDLKTVLNNSLSLSHLIEKYNKKSDSDKISEINEKLTSVILNGNQTVNSFLALGAANHIFNDSPDLELDIEQEIGTLISNHDFGSKIDVTISKNEIIRCVMHKKAIESIFLNLFTNTIKYNKNKPAADIQFLQDNNQKVFIYKDNGIGIDLTKYEDELFKPFQRIENDLNQEGTGVGLYLVKRIIDHYNGTIEVESTLNEGVLFRFCMPNQL